MRAARYTRSLLLSLATNIKAATALCVCTRAAHIKVIDSGRARTAHFEVMESFGVVVYTFEDRSRERRCEGRATLVCGIIYVSRGFRAVQKRHDECSFELAQGFFTGPLCVPFEFLSSRNAGISWRRCV